MTCAVAGVDLLYAFRTAQAAPPPLRERRRRDRPEIEHARNWDEKPAHLGFLRAFRNAICGIQA